METKWREEEEKKHQILLFLCLSLFRKKKRDSKWGICVCWMLVALALFIQLVRRWLDPKDVERTNEKN